MGTHKTLGIRRQKLMSQNLKRLGKIRLAQEKIMTALQIRNNKTREKERLAKTASRKKSKKSRRIVRLKNVKGPPEKRYIGYNAMGANCGYICIVLALSLNKCPRMKILFAGIANQTETKIREKRKQPQNRYD